MKKPAAFSRFHMLMAMAQAMASNMDITFGQALASQGGYHSRGKGKGSRVPSHTNYGRSKYKPHQGSGEIARRAAQISRGQLSPVHRAS